MQLNGPFRIAPLLPRRAPLHTQAVPWACRATQGSLRGVPAGSRSAALHDLADTANPVPWPPGVRP
jgi:hypothetical protein